MKAEFEYTARINEDWEKETETAVLEMEPYGQRGWIWTTNGGISYGSTNEEGEGLWDGTQQVLGTTQFNLPSKDTKAIRILAKRHAKARANTGCGQIKHIKLTHNNS